MTDSALIQSLADHVQATLREDMLAGRVPPGVRSWRDVARYVEISDYGIDHPAWTEARDGDAFLRRQEAAFEIVAHRLGWGSAPTCPCQLGLCVPDAVPKATGRVRIDKAALRLALGGQPEIVEAMEAKASGTLGVNAATVWRFFTESVYTSGDLPVLATRETLQNGLDAIKAEIRARRLRADAGRFEVTWDAEARSITWRDCHS